MRHSAILLCVIALACCRSRGAVAVADSGTPEPSTPAAISISADRKDLIFTFTDENGRLKDVDSLDKIPVERRGQVLVRDLSKRPEEVRADQYAYIADLTKEPDADGGYPYAIVSRFNVERSIKVGDFGAVEEDAGSHRVTLYGTSWCGACAQARAWFKERGIDYADKDIEKDPKAEAEMGRKLRRAGMTMGGVPVIDVGGKVMMGFDPRQLEIALKAI